MDREETGADRMVHIRQSELDALLEQAAERGGEKACTETMAKLGLHNGEAAQDIAEMRRLAQSLRSARSTAWQALIRGLMFAVLALLAAGLAVKSKVIGG